MRPVVLPMEDSLSEVEVDDDDGDDELGATEEEVSVGVGVDREAEESVDAVAGTCYIGRLSLRPTEITQ